MLPLPCPPPPLLLPPVLLNFTIQPVHAPWLPVVWPPYLSTSIDTIPVHHPKVLVKPRRKRRGRKRRNEREEIESSNRDWRHSAELE